MREVLFRAQRVDNNECVHGDLLTDGRNKLHNLIFILPSEADSYDFNLLVQVIPETVGQFIGLDKKGNKVFEGMKTIDGSTILWNKEKNIYAEHKQYNQTSEFVCLSYPMFLSEIEIDINS